MNILLIGYGKMGKEVEQIALSKGHTIIARIDKENPGDLNSENASKADVAIEFSIPSAAVENIYTCFDINLPVVSGTTGWHEQLPEVSKKCINLNQSLFYASNYSIGVNLFFSLNATLSKLMNGFPSYDVFMKEVHHTQKLDAPSGTAVSLADIILQNISRKNNWVLENPAPQDIPIEAIREGQVTGIHSVKYDSDIDFIELTHHAKNRKGFAQGAVLAAEYLCGKKGVYTMHDLLGV